MRPTTLLLGLLFLANSCAVSHPPAPAAQPPAIVDAPIAAPTIEPTATVDAPPAAPAIKPTVPVEAPPAAAPVVKPTTPVDAPAPLIKPTPAVEAPTAALINPTAGGNAPPAAQQAELPADTTIDQVLDALDQRGQSMREFTAKISRTKGDNLVGDLKTETGKLLFQKKGDDDGRLRVIFEKRIDGNVTRDEKNEVLLDNGWVIERDYRKQSETRREIVKPGERMNLLKLGEGPFPLLIGQKKEEVKKLFDVTKVPVTPEDGADLADTIHLKFMPKPGTRFSRRLQAMNIWVSRKNNFPVRIDTIAHDDADPQTTKLDDLKINPQSGLKDGDFELPKIDQDVWSLHTEPYKD